jgi:menaquinol-cytochrome c reductase iron-sulfur subunit
VFYDEEVTRTEPPPADELTRRGFYLGAVYAMWGAIAAALGLPALVYLFIPPRVRKAEEWVEVGDVTQLAPNSPVEMSFRRNRVDGWKVTNEKGTAWVVKHADNSIVAFGPECTHLGCAYHWEDGKNDFLCPCHTSVFSADGKVISGPAPRPLDRYDTKIQGSKLLLGKLRQSEGQNG